jgi:hypothetical protein
MGPSLNAVLSDIHQIASGVGAKVAVLSGLSNRKSRVCTPGTRHHQPMTGPAAGLPPETVSYLIQLRIFPAGDWASSPCLNPTLSPALA